MSVELNKSTDPRCCLHCGEHVSHDFARVFGDGANDAHRCPACDTWIRIMKGSAAGASVRTPDPETSLGRGGLSGRRSL